MMRITVFLILFFFGSAAGQRTTISELRNLYQRAEKQEGAARDLLKLTNNFTEENPVFFGYKGAAHMMLSKHVINPFSKMSHFNKGKKIYSSAIEADPGNIELRFLRFAVQSEAPSFLGYKNNLEADKQFLLNKIEGVNDPELRKLIFDYLLSSEVIGTLEKEKLLRKSN